MSNCIVDRGAIGGKTGKIAVLPGFCKIEQDGGSGGTPVADSYLRKSHQDVMPQDSN